jgi:hypothetical protein
MSEDLKAKKIRLLSASEKGVDELIKVLEQPIITNGTDLSDLGADKMKNAVAAKKLALLDALEMIDTINKERDKIENESKNISVTAGKQGWAEGRAKQGGR